MNLTHNQQQLIQCLGKVDPNSIWGLAIHKVLKEVSVEKLNSLIEQLKSQERDNPDVMREILSNDCYEFLINYKS